MFFNWFICIFTFDAGLLFIFALVTYSYDIFLSHFLPFLPFANPMHVFHFVQNGVCWFFFFFIKILGTKSQCMQYVHNGMIEVFNVVGLLTYTFFSILFLLYLFSPSLFLSYYYLTYYICHFFPFIFLSIVFSPPKMKFGLFKFCLKKII